MTLPGVETKTQANTVDQEDAEGEVDTLPDTLTKVESKSNADTLGDVQPKTLVDTLTR